MSTFERDLSGFTGAGYEIGRGRLTQALWMLLSGAVFVRWWCPARLRISILRAFGATVGDDVLVRHRVRVHWPWKLTIGDNSWIGEGVWLLNLDPITIGRNVCVSQEAFLCTGSHDKRSKSFEFDNGPIEIADGAWVAARATILRGVRVGRGCTIGATTLVTKSVPDGSILLASKFTPASQQ